MAITTKKRIGNNKAVICVTENGEFVTKPVSIFGSVRMIVGEKAGNEQIARLVQDLKQKKFDQSIKVELCTGGPYVERFHGYKNWFPGSTTYGFIKNTDALLKDKNKNQLYDEHGNGLYVPRWDSESPLEGSIVEILDALDDVMVDPYMQAKWDIYFHVKTPSGDTGYISALTVSDIFYKVKD